MANVFSGVRPSSAAATSTRSSGSDFPNVTGSPCVSAPGNGRTPLNTSRHPMSGRPVTNNFGMVRRFLFSNRTLAFRQEAIHCICPFRSRHVVAARQRRHYIT